MSKIKNIISCIIVALSLATNSNAIFAFSLQQYQPPESEPSQGDQFDLEQNELPLNPHNQWDMLIYRFEENLQRDRQLINEINQNIRQINTEFN